MLPRLSFREEVSEKIWGHDDLEAARKERREAKSRSEEVPELPSYF